MVTIYDVKNIVIEWANVLPCKVKVHLFGSFLKGDNVPSDIDISLEFLEPLSETQRTLLWFDNHEIWETYLSGKFGLKAHLCLYEKENKYMPKNLKKSSLLLYDSTEMEV